MSLVIVGIMLNIVLAVINVVIMVALINGHREVKYSIMAAARIVSRPVIEKKEPIPPYYRRMDQQEGGLQSSPPKNPIREAIDEAKTKGGG